MANELISLQAVHTYLQSGIEQYAKHPAATRYEKGYLAALMEIKRVLERDAKEKLFRTIEDLSFASQTPPARGFNTLR